MDVFSDHKLGAVDFCQKNEEPDDATATTAINDNQLHAKFIDFDNVTRL